MSISVVLCTYNGEKFIEAQLSSIRSQTRPADEVLIRDDKSTDDTAAIITRFIKTHALSTWSFRVNEVNLGYIRNFHATAKEAASDYIAFADQDDIWLPEKLRLLEDVFLSRPDAKVVAGAFTMIDAEGRPVDAPLDPKRANANLIPFPVKSGALLHFPSMQKNAPLLLGGNVFLGCTLMFSREIQSIYAQYSETKILHDWEIVLIGGMLDGLYFLNEPTILYRVHGKNAIGLPFGERGKSQITPSTAGRLHIMDNYEGAIAAYDHLLRCTGQPPLSPEYTAYARLRRAAITERSATKWLGLMKYRSIYRRMFTLRQRLGDLYVILRR